MGEIISFPMYPDSRAPFDLGGGFSFRFADWAPDRNIPANNVRYHDVPDVERICIILKCPHGKDGVVHLDRGEIYKNIFGDRPWWWTVEQEEPLTISPSIATGCCHGFIRDGKWVDA
jgi:hypothetical protein